MADESQTCCTVETPSRLMLFYPESTPSSLTSLLPTLPLCKPMGHQLVLGRSSSADVRLNDERMSRAYAALWHDGKDPFVFRVSNLSERKLLTVDGAMLRYKEEAEVKDGSVLVMDFLEFKAKVCAGDMVAFNYQVSFVKNVVMSPVSPKPPDGKCFMPPRRDETDISSSMNNPCRSPLENTGNAVRHLLTCLRLGSLDSAMGSVAGNRSSAAGFPGRSYSCCESVGIEYELPENVCTVSSGYSSGSGDNSPWSGHITPFSSNEADNRIPLNIPLQRSSSDGHRMLPPARTTHEQKSPNHAILASRQTSTQPCSAKKSLSCWFNINPDPAPVPQPQKDNPEKNIHDLPGLAQQVQDNLVLSKQSVCPSCRGCGEGAARPATLEQGPRAQQPTLTLPDMVLKQGNGRRSPVENGEWDTDDPNINCFME